MPPKRVDYSGYQYSALSSQVTSADRSLIGRIQNEPTGEVESLVGRIDPKGMGSRAGREAVKDLNKKKEKALKEDRVKDVGNIGSGKDKRGAAGNSLSIGQSADILQATAELEGLRYQPRTFETRQTYELILSLAHTLIGDQAQDVVRSAADTIIEILKDDDLRDLDKLREIREVVGAGEKGVSDEQFTQLVNLSKKITDFDEDEKNTADPDAERALANLDEDTGVAVMFEGEDEESDPEEEVFVERGSDDEDEDGDDAPPQGDGEGMDDEAGEDGAPADNTEALVIGSDRTSARKAAQSGLIAPTSIDAFFLQRLIGQTYTDEHVASEKASAAFDILAADTNIRDCENSLMELFDYEHFELVKMLTQNRDVVVWCTKLARADADEKINVEVEMREKSLGWILRALRGDAGKQNGTSKGGEGAKPMLIDEEAVERAKRLTMKATLAPGSMLKPRKAVDLSAMAFTQGGHLNSNPKVKLPPNSFKRTKKGYEEIHVPAPQKKEIPAEEIVPITALPVWAQKAFPGAKALNPVQSKCYPIAFGTDDPMLLCAPTGAGKTNVAMLTILNEVAKWRDPETGAIDLNAFKIVYVAPMKALVAEQTGNFRDRLKDYGITVNELTGDSQLNKQQIAETQIIVTTPEKWDVISRKSSDTSYTNLVRLMIIDEIHLLHDDRGPVLEAIVSRTIRRMEQLNDPVRLVGLSATLPNYEDVATFLRVDPKKGLFYFESAYRPCPLKQEFIGITEKKAIKRFQVMNEVAYEKAFEQAGKNQVLIFTHSRKETAKTAKYIRDHAMEQDTLSAFLPQSLASREILQTGECSLHTSYRSLADIYFETEGENVTDPNLKDLLPYGFGIHHAGMTRADRQLCEELFADGHLQVLVSTATLVSIEPVSRAELHTDSAFFFKKKNRHGVSICPHTRSSSRERRSTTPRKADGSSYRRKTCCKCLVVQGVRNSTPSAKVSSLPITPSYSTT